MRALKIVLGIVGGLLVIIALAVAALFFVDPSAYRDQLQARASAALGRAVELNGPIALEPSLQPHIVLQDLVIGNAEWAADPHLVAIQEAKVKLRLLPLLLGKLTFPRVSLSGVDLNLEKRSDGLTNFTFGEADEPRERDEPTMLPDIQRLLIQDARVQYRSESGAVSDLEGSLQWKDTGPRPTLIAEFSSETIELPQPAPEAQAQNPLDRPIDIDWLKAVDVDITASVQRVVGRGIPLEQLKIETVTSDGQLTAPFSVRAASVFVNGQVKLAESKGDSVLSLRAEAAQVNVGKFLELLGIAKETPRWTVDKVDVIELQASSQGGTVRSLLEGATANLKVQGGLRYSDKLLHKAVKVNVKSVDVSVANKDPLKVAVEGALGEGPLSLTAETATVAKLISGEGPWPLNVTFETSAVQVKSRGSVTQPLEGKGFELAFEAGGDDVTKLDPLLDFVFPFKGAFLIKGQFADRKGTYTLDQLEARVGTSELNGNISITTNGPRPKLVASLAAQAIDFHDLYFVAAEDAQSREESYVIPDYAIPVDALKVADIDLEFSTERVRIGARSLGNLRFKIKLENGRFVMSPFTGSHPTGTRVNGSFELDASTSPPKLQVQFTAKGLDYGLLLNHLAVTDLMEGQVDIHLDLSGSGATRRSLISRADGQLVIIGGEGKIRSQLFELWAADLVTTMLSPQWQQESITDVKCIAVHVDMQNGKAEINDLLLDTRRITIAGVGILYLGTEELDILIAPRPKNPSFVSLANPVEITGTLANPNVTVRIIPRRGRLLGAGLGILAGLINPVFLLAAFADTGTGYGNPCESATERVSSQIDRGGS